MDQVFLYINTEHSVQEVMTLLYIKLLYKMDHYFLGIQHLGLGLSGSVSDAQKEIKCVL